MADRLDDRQLDDRARQQPQRPVGIALRGRPQTQGDEVSLLFAVEQFGDRGGLPPFSFQRLLEPFQHASLANVLDRLGAARKGVGDLLIGPRRPVRIGLQENLSAAHFLTAAVELSDRLSTDLAFLHCESNDVLFLHRNSLRFHGSSPIALMFTYGKALGSRSSRCSSVATTSPHIKATNPTSETRTTSANPVARSISMESRKKEMGSRKVVIPTIWTPWRGCWLPRCESEPPQTPGHRNEKAQGTSGPPIQDRQTPGRVNEPQRGGDEHCGCDADSG